MPKPVKEFRPGGVATFNKPTAGDVVQRKDKDEAVKEANTPKKPTEARISGETDPSKFRNPAEPTAKTLVVLSPPQVSKKDATGMMASKPLGSFYKDSAPPPVAVKTTDPRVNPIQAGIQAQTVYGPAQQELTRPVQPASGFMHDSAAGLQQAAKDNRIAIASAGFGPLTAAAMEAVKRLKAQGKIK